MSHELVSSRPWLRSDTSASYCSSSFVVIAPPSPVVICLFG